MGRAASPSSGSSPPSEEGGKSSVEDGVAAMGVVGCCWRLLRLLGVCVEDGVRGVRLEAGGGVAYGEEFWRRLLRRSG